MIRPSNQDPSNSLRARFAGMSDVDDVDPDTLATGAMRRGRQRRQRRRGVVATATGAVALALTLPALAGGGPAQLDTAGDGHEASADAPDDRVEPGDGHGDDDPDHVAPTPEPGDGDHEDESSDEGDDEADQPDEPDPTTTTTERHEEPDPTTTTTVHDDEKPEFEQLEIWCGRSEGEEAGGVVCEWSLSERDDFYAYRLYRRCAEEGGQWEHVWSYEQREMPDRPWPDIRHLDPDASADFPWMYKVVVVDAEGHQIGGSNIVTVPMAEGPPDGGDGGDGDGVG